MVMKCRIMLLKKIKLPCYLKYIKLINWVCFFISTSNAKYVFVILTIFIL